MLDILRETFMNTQIPFWKGSLFGYYVKNVPENSFLIMIPKMILEGEIKDAIISSFSSDFQTLIKH